MVRNKFICVWFFSDRELMFVSFPEALSFISGSSGWTVTFYLLLILVGLDTQMTLVHTILAGIVDEWAVLLYSRRLWVLLGICLFSFFFSLPLVTQVSLPTSRGMFMFVCLQRMPNSAVTPQNLIDHHSEYI